MPALRPWSKTALSVMGMTAPLCVYGFCAWVFGSIYFEKATKYPEIPHGLLLSEVVPSQSFPGFTQPKEPSSRYGPDWNQVGTMFLGRPG